MLVIKRKKKVEKKKKEDGNIKNVIFHIYFNIFYINKYKLININFNYYYYLILKKTFLLKIFDKKKLLLLLNAIKKNIIYF